MQPSRSSASRSLLLAAASALLACSSQPAPASSASDAGPSGIAAGVTAPSGAVGCAADMGVDSYSAGLTKPGGSGLFSFELVSSSPAPPALNDNVFVVQVNGPDGSPRSGQLSADLVMPDHGHSTLVPPVITFDATAGAFTLDPMDLFMVGLWRITLTFQPDGADSDAGAAGAPGADAGAAVSDTAVFQFCVN